MAQRVHIVLEDDVDGGDAAETVTFGLDGVTYEIDLNQTNARKFRDQFAPWLGHARRASGRRSGARRTPPGSGVRRTDLSGVRAWARKNGFTVSDRGRVSGEVQAAYDKAHG